MLSGKKERLVSGFSPFYLRHTVTWEDFSKVIAKRLISFEYFPTTIKARHDNLSIKHGFGVIKYLMVFTGHRISFTFFRWNTKEILIYVFSQKLYKCLVYFFYFHFFLHGRVYRGTDNLAKSLIYFQFLYRRILRKLVKTILNFLLNPTILTITLTSFTSWSM